MTVQAILNQIDLSINQFKAEVKPLNIDYYNGSINTLQQEIHSKFDNYRQAIYNYITNLNIGLFADDRIKSKIRELYDARTIIINQKCFAV